MKDVIDLPNHAMNTVAKQNDQSATSGQAESKGYGAMFPPQMPAGIRRQRM